MTKLYRYFRWWNYIRTFFGSYFWLPCPRCGKYFGGHEWKYSDQSLNNQGICLECYEICKQNGEIKEDIQREIKRMDEWYSTKMER